ncbi:preprotein translocase subunit TatA [Candidatus Endobugula sertula]|uniref:Sec-independent protein translocase protein TatA n=1 Tax=Candidatus Endobugula sertula TaxID=62101 RepID=A0A1D2QRF1_9GAMM|nr:preprotein translocase subunit TatA [Candidatus Endobugula sertula]
MGFGGISVWQLLIILAIVVLLFGTKKLRGMGSDLGSAFKGFREAIGADEAGKDDSKIEDEQSTTADAVEKAEYTSEKK